MFEGQRGVFVVGGYGDGETATLFFDLNLREWKTLPDLPAGGGVTLSNPGGLSGEHPLVMGGNLEDQVLEFDGLAWRALEVKLTSRANGQSTTVSQEFASWLRTLDQVSIPWQARTLFGQKSINHNFHHFLAIVSVCVTFYANANCHCCIFHHWQHYWNAMTLNHKVDFGEENICSSGGGGEDGKLRLSNIYADHMVFQVVIITCTGFGYTCHGIKIFSASAA